METCAGSLPLPGRGLAARSPRPSNAGLSPAAVQGNNEVSMWDMETGDRRLTLWASSAPPLSELQVRPASSPTPPAAQEALPATILGGFGGCPVSLGFSKCRIATLCFPVPQVYLCLLLWVFWLPAL